MNLFKNNIKWCVAIIVMFLFVFFDKGVCGQEPVLKRYLIEKAIIEYQIRGTQNGAEVLYFDNWGMREVKYKSATRRKFGMENIMTLLKEGMYYTIDLDKRIGTKIPNKLLESLIEEYRSGNIQDLGSGWMAKMQGQMIGTEMVADKMCEVWEVEKVGARYWMWHWIPLKVSVKTGDETLTITAKKIHENVDVPEDKFNMPEKIYFMEGDLDDVILSRIYTIKTKNPA